MILYQHSENDCVNPIFLDEPETTKPWGEYYRQLAMHGKLLMFDDPVVRGCRLAAIMILDYDYRMHKYPSYAKHLCMYYSSGQQHAL